MGECRLLERSCYCLFLEDKACVKKQLHDSIAPIAMKIPQWSASVMRNCNVKRVVPRKTYKVPSAQKRKNECKKGQGILKKPYPESRL